jgi:polyisoprenoid-binding protein YceI
MSVNELNGTYTIDPAHSRLGFSARHAMVTKVRGAFNEVTGAATTGPGLEGARIEIDVVAESVDTRQADRDAHLRSADFFDCETYPTISFRSTEVTAVDDDTLRVTGDLTIKDVTRPVTIDFDYAGAAQDPFGNTRVGFEGSTAVNRKDFGLTWNAALETGGFLVSENVTLEFEVSAIKSA